jgi:predicted amidohydrolase
VARLNAVVDRIQNDPKTTMKVAAYQAPLLFRSSTETIELIAEQVKACEAAGVDILCCPEDVLGGLADHSERPADLAMDVESGQLRTRLSPLASDSVTTHTQSGGPRGELV